MIIGNPPYNANQKNENENNKNREYPTIDKRIKDTYIKYSTAQKTKVYDMYARFYRWASDRVDKNGIIGFCYKQILLLTAELLMVSENVLQKILMNCYIIDLKGDVRAQSENCRNEGAQCFLAIQTGVAIMFLVKKEKQEGNCKIEYTCNGRLYGAKEEKLDWLQNQ